MSDISMPLYSRPMFFQNLRAKRIYLDLPLTLPSGALQT